MPSFEALLTVDEFERAARDRLPAMAYDYFRSGADDERTLADNVAAFSRYAIWPRVLRDVARRDLAVELLGCAASSPILIAPTAYHGLAHPDREPATARGAATAGTILVVSTLANTRIEEIAAAAPGPKWFQLYVHRDRGMTRALIERAAAAGYLALVLTVDTPLLGRRLADERNGFALPPGLEMANLVDGNEGSGAGGSALAGWFAARHDASLGWSDLAWLRSVTDLPIVLKGILRADDAARAVAEGVAGIIVSNHGGRQLDGAPATLDALPSVAEAVAGRCALLVDGGIRRGTDILIALALGAQAVLVGRPVLWGLAVAGEHGVARVLDLLRDELSRAMALAGCPDLASISRDLVRPR
ncbi:MAG: alpha-hydroxy-acid oxidizing protein [Myxococcales bacterium]|nr:alpha-hydroxy-acid oxidizing protein [Myxococcales bacterium]